MPRIITKSKSGRVELAPRGRRKPFKKYKKSGGVKAFKNKIFSTIREYVESVDNTLTLSEKNKIVLQIIKNSPGEYPKWGEAFKRWKYNHLKGSTDESTRMDE